MANQPPPTSSEEDGQKEKSQYDNSWEGKLARDLYSDHSSENELFKQLVIAASLLGVAKANEIILAYNLLKKPLDPKKLVEDLVYKRQVERALQIVKKREGSRLADDGNSKYKVEVKRTESALRQVNSIHGEQIKIKTSFSEPYLATLRSVYGLEDKDLKSIYAAATQRIKDNPTLSMQDALRIDAQEIAQKKIHSEAEKDPGLKKLNKKQRQDEINRRLATKDAEFRSKTSTSLLYETGRSQEVRQTGTREIAKTLGVELRPVTAPLIPSPQPPLPPLPKIQNVQQFTLPKISFPQITSSISGLNRGLGGFFSRIGESGIAGLFKSGITKLGGGLVKSAASFFGKQALLKGLGGVLSGGLLTAASLAADALKALTLGLVDIEGWIWGAAKFAVLAVAGIVVLISFGILGGTTALFTSKTIQNPLVVKNYKQNDLSWREFEEKYLIYKPEETASNYSWAVFEKGYLMPQKAYLSSDINEISQ